ncbi:MAG: hypothetical protein QM764_09945 [Chitinophagaceae bacterium]
MSFSTDIKLYNEKLINFHHLKKIARLCAILNFEVAIVSIVSSILFPQSNFMTICCGIIAILCSLTPVIYALYVKRFDLVFSCICIFNVAPIWFLYLETVLPGYDAYLYSPAIYKMKALGYSCLFLMFVNTLYAFFQPRGVTTSVGVFSFLNTIRPTAKFYVHLTFMTFIVPIVAFLIFYQSAEILWHGLTSGRSGGGGSGILIREPVGGSATYMLPFLWMWQLTPLFGIIAFVQHGKKKTLAAYLCLLLSLCVMFVFFLGGSRGTMFFVSAPALFFLFFYNWDKGVKFWAFAVVLFFAFIAIMELQVRFRGNLLKVIANPTAEAKSHGLSSVTSFDPTKTHRDNNMYIFCLMVKAFPRKQDFVGFNDFFAILLNPIPRTIWPGKPLLMGAKDISAQPKFILDGPLEMGTTSLTSSVVGEAYQANGVWGLFVYSIVYAALLIFFEGISFYVSRKKPLSVGMTGIGLFLSFWGFRSFFALISYIYPITLLIVSIKFISFIKKSRENYVYST